jgi:hypothetical protein
MLDASPEFSPKPSRREKRQRNHKTDTRWDDAEYSILAERSQETGLSRNAYIRAAVTGTPGPRARRAPHLNAVELAKATAALNKAGSLLNQMAHVLNTGGSILTHECFAALAETRAALARILEIVGR